MDSSTSQCQNLFIPLVSFCLKNTMMIKSQEQSARLYYPQIKNGYSTFERIGKRFSKGVFQCVLLFSKTHFIHKFIANVRIFLAFCCPRFASGSLASLWDTKLILLKKMFIVVINSVAVTASQTGLGASHQTSTQISINTAH